VRSSKQAGLSAGFKNRSGQPRQFQREPRSRSAYDSTADRTKGQSWRSTNMSDAFDYFRAYAVRALCKARSMPHGRMKHLQLMAGRIYNLLKNEAAYSPNTQHIEDFRAAQKLERSLDSRADVGPTVQGRFESPRPQNAGREAL
jgi:hypothetical protein